MPWLTEGGKYTYGWSSVGLTGRITIAPKALRDYGLKASDRLILVPGSHSSGGFGLCCRQSRDNPLMGLLAEARPDLWGFQIVEGSL